ICFVPDGDYRGFVRRHPLGRAAVIRPGEIVDCAGRVLGRHDGLINYTVGQRRRLRIAHRAPLYVVALDAAANRVIVGEKSEVFARGLIAREMNWMAFERLEKTIAGRVQIRYRHEAVPARIEPLGADAVRVMFETPQPAVTPGQAAVVYDESDEYVIGGGWIEESLR
ncbi:MAG: tRNA 2-thiouridine(34) synthase MnmA, partial [Candidatus Sumerlaeia bacterium]|nr:tRNA 2-thiouridine(34) synthase MnmA [Candidatus Sumerlaeia bacterium]